MTENIVNTPYHRQISLAKAGSVITQDQPTLTDVHLKLVRVSSVNYQQGLIGITGANDHTVNGNRIKKTVEQIPLPAKNYGINQDGNAYGTFPQVSVGDRVLLGYLSSNSANPIVLQIIPDTFILPHLSPVWYDDTGKNRNNLSKYRSQKEVFPSQQVELKKGNGDYEHTLNGGSFIAQLDSTNTNDTPWREDNYTGIPSKNDYGKPLDASVDHSTGDAYQIQNNTAQDWVKVHQSNDGLDHHITKRLVNSNGSIHNFIGNKLFKNDKITEDASLDNGYSLKHSSGKVNSNSKRDIKHLIQYAKAQIRNHIYGAFNVNKANFPTEAPKRGYSYYNGHMVKQFQWGFDNEIDYNPKNGSSNGLHFIYSILKECHFDVSDGCWPNSGMMYDYLAVRNPVKISKPKAGDIAFKCLFKQEHHESSLLWVPHYSKPSLVIEKYHGPKTKCIAEYKAAGNVKQSTLGHLYDVGPHNDGNIEFIVFARPTKTTTASAKFSMKDDNSLSLAVTDPTIPNWANQNQFKLTADHSQWSCMGHKIDINKKGISVDGKNFNDLLNDSKTKITNLKSKNKTLSSKFKDLVKLLKRKKIVPRDFK